MTPEELWREAIRGSQPAWEKLYAMFGGRLYQFFLKNTGETDLSMDLTQCVFERLYRHREAFHTGNLKTWIYHIARNLLIDEWRRKPRREVLAESMPEVADTGIRIEDWIIQKLDREQMVKLIDECLPKLPEDDRIIIGLIYLGGLSIPELAKVTEVPLGTAKTRVRQARLRLDRMLTANLKHISESEVA